MDATHRPVYLVPAFTGLGAPHWAPQARAALHNLTRATRPAHIARAALESIAWQTRDLLEAIARDWPAARRATLRVDGGMAASDWTMQNLANTLQLPVVRPPDLESTARGAAYLAGRQAGVYPDLEQFAANWQAEREFQPGPDREEGYRGWLDAVGRVVG